MTEERIETIRKRAEQYAAGQITLQDFVMLEKAETEQPPHYGADFTAEAMIEALEIRDRREQQALHPTKALSLQEFNKMSLRTQQTLYNEMESEISSLIRGKATAVDVPLDLLEG